MTYALIIANPDNSDLGNIVSRHRTVNSAGVAMRKLSNSRWAYVAQRRADGSYPLRCEALDLAAHAQAVTAGDIFEMGLR